MTLKVERQVSHFLQVWCQKMSETKYLKGECQPCGGHIEFPADAVGTTIECPHCGQPTELMLAAPPEEPTIPRSTLVWTAMTVLVLVVGLVGALVALKRAEKGAAARQKSEKSEPSAAAGNPVTAEADDPLAKAGFGASEINLQKNPDSSLVYAVGTLTNNAGRQRFGVKLFLDLYDDSGQKTGGATDYQQVIEPHGQWNFKALVVDSKAVSAKIGALTEDYVR